MKRKEIIDLIGFVTIWIFARLRPENVYPEYINSFVTIWIFARLRQSKKRCVKRSKFCYHMDFC